MALGKTYIQMKLKICIFSHTLPWNPVSQTHFKLRSQHAPKRTPDVTHTFTSQPPLGPTNGNFSLWSGEVPASVPDSSLLSTSHIQFKSVWFFLWNTLCVSHLLPPWFTWACYRKLQQVSQLPSLVLTLLPMQEPEQSFLSQWQLMLLIWLKHSNDFPYH